MLNRYSVKRLKLIAVLINVKDVIILKDQLINPSTFICKVKPECNEMYPWSDIGDSRLFAHCYKGIIRYVLERKCWYVYHDGIWQEDLCGLRVMALCKEFACALKQYSRKIKTDDTQKHDSEHCKKWQRRSGRETILKDACDICPTSINDFDTDLHTLNCHNGTLHLDTMEFTKYRPEVMLTKMCPVDYDPNAKCERFERFICEIMSDDMEKARFLQKALGYALSGMTHHECMFVLWGESTRNGKSTLAEIVRKVLGTYACSAKAETLGLNNYANGQSHSEDVARLVGMRYVNIPEPDKGLVFNSGLVKSLTGNNTVNARRLYENSFDYAPKFKLFLDCNHLPLVNDMTLFDSRRLVIIPFTRHFGPVEQDRGLKSFFAQPENQSGILNWLIAGYHLLTEEGLDPPASVLSAMGVYEEDSDLMSLFVKEHLVADPTAEVRTSEVYKHYRSWCEENCIVPESARMFNDSLRRIGTIARKRPRSGGGMTTMLLGYQLVPTEPCNE